MKLKQFLTQHQKLPYILLLLLLISGCKKCPELMDPESTTYFGFWLLHKETGLPLVTDDSSITTYPPGSVKLVNERGIGWNDTRSDVPPNGYGFSISSGGYKLPPNDTLFFYLHFLTTNDIDTIKVRKILYEHDCQQAFSFEYFYNNEAVAIDSSKNIHTANRIDHLTLYKQP